MTTDTKFVSSLRLEIDVDSLPELTDEDLVELKRKVEEEIEKRHLYWKGLNTTTKEKFENKWKEMRGGVRLLIIEEGSWLLADDYMMQGDDVATFFFRGNPTGLIKLELIRRME